MIHTLDQTNEMPSSLLVTSEDGWWLEMTKREKAAWMQSPNNFKGDLPPVVVAEKNNQILAFVRAPDMDKAAGIVAARQLRQGLDADTLTVIMDGHIPIGKMAREVAERVQNGTWRAGEMQRMCDNEAACEKKQFTDCMIVQRITSNSCFLHILTYSYEGKGSGKLTWTPEYDIANLPGVHVLGGAVSSSLTEVMSLPPLWEAPRFAETWDQYGEKLSCNKRQFFAHLVLGLLRNARYKVYDFTGNPLRSL